MAYPTMKLLVHAINGIGIGHVVRTYRVMDALRELRPDVDIVFVTNSKYYSMLKRDYKTYPLKKDTGGVRAGLYSYEEYLQYNTMAIRKVLSHELPDVVLFDSELNRELMLFCKKNLVKIAYILRIPTAERFMAIKDDLNLFDAIIVPHKEEDFPLAQKKILRELHSSFVGPIVDLNDPPERCIRKNILITLGSGARIPENLPLFSAVNLLLQELRDNNFLIDNHNISVDIVTGPFYTGGCNLNGVSVRATTDSLVQDMFKSKLVISGAGYNTINEIIRSKTPAVVIPLSRKWDDQFQRAKIYEALGCIKIAYKGILGPIREILKDWKSYHHRFPEMKNGNRQSASILSGLLGYRKE